MNPKAIQMNSAMTSVKANSFFLSLLLIILPGFFLNTAYGQNIPTRPDPPRLVNDFAEMLSESERVLLENKLVAYFDSTSTQIAVVTINSLEGASAADYAATLGEKWGVGTKENHNGVIILISKGDRDGYIATGYGVEDGLNNFRCQEIYDNIVIPNLKSGNYYAAFDEATDAMIDILSGKFVNTNPKGNKADKITAKDIFIILFIIIIIFIIASKFGDRSTTINRRGYNDSSPWFGGGGSGWGGGGGSSSGGFGGFGGGGFSGGGAGGKW